MSLKYVVVCCVLRNFLNGKNMNYGLREDSEFVYKFPSFYYFLPERNVSVKIHERTWQINVSICQPTVSRDEHWETGTVNGRSNFQRGERFRKSRTFRCMYLGFQLLLARKLF